MYLGWSINNSYSYSYSWSETLKRNIFFNETKLLKRNKAKWSKKNFPEFCEKEAKPSETVCVSLSFALKRNFFRSETFLEVKLGHPSPVTWQHIFPIRKCGECPVTDNIHRTISKMATVNKTRGSVLSHDNIHRKTYFSHNKIGGVSCHMTTSIGQHIFPILKHIVGHNFR